MSDGVFDPSVSLDDLNNVGGSLTDKGIDGLFDNSLDTLINNKEFLVLGILILIMIGYNTYDNINNLNDKKEKS